MSAEDYKAIVHASEEYRSLKELGLSDKEIMEYFKNYGNQVLHNDEKHRKRQCIYYDKYCDSKTGLYYEPSFLGERDKYWVYRESIPIMKQTADRWLLSILSSLSPRQQMIVELMVHDYTGVQIARFLGISPPAVTKHLRAIKKALLPYYEDYYAS